PREWELNLAWSEYRDSLRIHGEEAVVGDSQVPWFWASRCGLEPGMEDRYFLWLPWHWELLELAVGQGGWIDSSVRWQVGRREVVFVDEGALEGTGS
ncbi:MAG: hypothetical protein GY856_26690, partial [bacterium]|nr:hypothetical protein [bacterium]